MVQAIARPVVPNHGTSFINTAMSTLKTGAEKGLEVISKIAKVAFEFFSCCASATFNFCKNNSRDIIKVGAGFAMGAVILAVASKLFWNGTVPGMTP